MLTQPQILGLIAYGGNRARDGWFLRGSCVRRGGEMRCGVRLCHSPQYSCISELIPNIRSHNLAEYI